MFMDLSKVSYFPLDDRLEKLGLSPQAREVGGGGQEHSDGRGGSQRTIPQLGVHPTESVEVDQCSQGRYCLLSSILAQVSSRGMHDARAIDPLSEAVWKYAP